MGTCWLPKIGYVLVLLGALPTNNAKQETLQPLFVGEDSTYYISNFKSDAATARQECSKLGNFQLISLETQDEDNSVLFQMKARGLALPFWTSGVEKIEDSNKVYVWESTSEPISYSNFAEVMKHGVKKSNMKKRTPVTPVNNSTVLCECGGTTPSPAVPDPNDCDPNCVAPKCTVSPANCTTVNPTCTVEPVKCSEADQRVCKSTCPPCLIVEPPKCLLDKSPVCTITPGKCTVENSQCRIEASKNCTTVRPPCENFYKNCTKAEPVCTPKGPCSTTPNPCQSVRPPCTENCTTLKPPCYERPLPCRAKSGCTGGNCMDCPGNSTICPEETTTCKTSCQGGHTTCKPIFDCKPKAVVCMSPPLICSYNETYCPPAVTTCTEPIIVCDKPHTNCADPTYTCTQPTVTCDPAKIVCPAPTITCSDAVSHCDAPIYNCSNPQVTCPAPVVECEKIQDCIPCTIATAGPPPPPTTETPCKCKKISVDNEGAVSPGGCIALEPKNGFKWEVQNCADKNYFLCETVKACKGSACMDRSTPGLRIH